MRSLGPILIVLVTLPACTTSSTDDGTTTGTTVGSDETGSVLIPKAGTYQVQTGVKTGECRTEEEAENFELEMPVPEGGGAWDLTESYSGEDVLRQEPYPCDLTDDFAICGIRKDRDYNEEGMDVFADVKASRQWEFEWTTETEFTGQVIVDLSCEGSSCDDIAGEWLVNEWPCNPRAEITGTLKE